MSLTKRGSQYGPQVLFNVLSLTALLELRGLLSLAIGLPVGMAEARDVVYVNCERRHSANAMNTHSCGQFSVV